VARVLARLAALPTLSDVRLTASSRVNRGPESAEASNTAKTKKQKPVVTFTITASIRPLGAA
jgi:hypothetical protein